MSYHYAGDISLLNAWSILQDNRASFLVDVRTYVEWETVGIPDLSTCNKEVLFLQWRCLPDMTINPIFIKVLSNAIDSLHTTLLFLCRSGHRSKEAAAAAYQAGYHNSYNIVSGFEGNHSTTSTDAVDNIGWKSSLPWKKE